MTTIRDKVEHVLNAPLGAGDHTCHWPGCTVRCKPAFWGCKKHWYTLPAVLRSAIWRAYKPGQEDTKIVSDDYVKVARSVQNWIARNHPPPAPPAQGDLLP